MLNKNKFDTREECINSYLSKYVNLTVDDIEDWVSVDRKFCIRIKGTKFTDSLTVYKINKKGQFTEEIKNTIK